MDAEHYLWQQHRFVVGEPVFLKGAKSLGPYKIVSAYFVGTNLRVTLTRGIGNCILPETDGGLPIMPAGLVNGDEIWHPKHGFGKVYALDSENKVLDMVSETDIITRVKLRKVRRCHMPPERYATPYSPEPKTPCPSSPMLSNLPPRKKN